MAKLYQLTVTASSAEEASRLGAMAVERRLAACAQVSGPVTSTYIWKGSVETATEWICTLKTTPSLVATLTRELRREHSYEVPEIVAVPIEDGDQDYLDWVATEATGGGG